MPAGRAVASGVPTWARQAQISLLVNDITGQGDEDGPTRRILCDLAGTRHSTGISSTCCNCTAHLTSGFAIDTRS